MRIVLAVDGSPVATRAARHVAQLYKAFESKPEVLLFYADEPLLRSVALDLGARGVDAYHADNGQHALKAARTALNRAGVDFTEQVKVGEPAQAIIKFAKSAKADLLVMGSHGRGAFKNLLLGSVVTKVLSQSTVPLTIVR